MKVYENPFAVKSPDQLLPEDVATYFVDTFTDFAKVSSAEHTFIHGARGTGKSMMLRGMDAPVQLRLQDGGQLRDLNHFGVHVPLKARGFRVPELSMPGGSASVALGEHFLTMVIATHCAITLHALSPEITPPEAELAFRMFCKLFRACGGNVACAEQELGEASSATFERLQALCESELRAFNRFTGNLAIDPQSVSRYQGGLCTFVDLLLPWFDHLRELESFPRGPAFLMLDDADNLPLTMQRVINTWISMRTISRCCLKVTTQLGYGTYRTLDWRLIETPHDFSEVDITAVYTSSQASFFDRMRQIVRKRLSRAGIDVSPELFFPEDEAQKARVQAMQEKIRETRQSESPSLGRRSGAARVADDVARYAVPEVMRELATGKSSHTFSYAGFGSLVNLSSGVIRWFLEPASEMFAEVVAVRSGDGSPTQIPVAVQDKIIRHWSARFLDDVQKLGNDHPSHLSPDASLHARVTPELCAALKNLLEAMGELFNRKLLDPTSSERRAFSFVVRGQVSDKLREVLSLGVRQGYLQTSDNAAKEGAFRRYPRIILARRLGPRFYLDVSGYAAHLSVTADDLELATNDPKAFVRQRLAAKIPESAQLSLLGSAGEVSNDDEG